MCAVVVTASPGGFQDPRTALAFAAFIALGEVVRITLPGGRDAAPIATAGALAYTLLTTIHGGPATHTALQVVAVAAAAMLAGVVPHVVAGRAPLIDTLARRLLVIGFAAGIFRGTELDEWLRPKQGWLQAMVMVAVVALALAADAVLAAAVRVGTDGAPFLAVLRNESRAHIGIGSAIGATGALIALAATIMGAWALPVFVIPLLLTQFSFRRFAAVRASTLQTIRALSRVTELGGYTETGHSRRVSELSVAVGRELGMSDAELLDLEYAALMHDIGQLSLTEPIPGEPPWWPRRPSSAASPRSAPRSSARPASSTALPPSSSSRPSPTGGPTRSSIPTCRWAAASSRRSTPTTTWSATRSRPLAASTRSSGCASAWPTSTTLAWSTRCPRPSPVPRGSEPPLLAAGAPRSAGAAGHEQQRHPGGDEYVARADHLGPPRQRHRDRVAEIGQPGVRPGPLVERVVAEAQVGAGQARPGGRADRDRHGEVDRDDDAVEQQPRRDERHPRDLPVAPQEQRDQQRAQHHRRHPHGHRAGRQRAAHELQHGRGHEQPHRAYPQIRRAGHRPLPRPRRSASTATTSTRFTPVSLACRAPVCRD